MALDYRSDTEINNSRYNSDSITLNTELEIFRAKPQLVDRQERLYTDPVVYHLEAQQ